MYMYIYIHIMLAEVRISLCVLYLIVEIADFVSFTASAVRLLAKQVMKTHLINCLALSRAKHTVRPRYD